MRTILAILSVFLFSQCYAQYGRNREQYLPKLDYNGYGRPTTQSPPTSQNQLQEIYNWAQFDFQYPNEQTRQEAIQSGAFVPINSSAPAGLEVHGKRVFISLPRWKSGVPATLNTIPFPSKTRSPLLSPYPDWETNRQGNCDGLTSVFRTQVDKCNRLWVIDTGTVNDFSTPNRICPPQVVAFDLLTDTIVHRYRLPDTLLRPGSQFVTIEVENTTPNGICGSPRDTFVYIADTWGYQLIVVDLAAETAWQVRDKTMWPSPEGGTFNAGGETFEMMAGVLSLAMSPESTQPERLLYYSSISGVHQRWVPTSILRSQSLATKSPKAFQTPKYALPSQTGDNSMDKNGVLFMGMLSDSSVACWNSHKSFEAKNIVTLAKNETTLQFPVEVVVDQVSRLWVFESKFQSFFLGTQIPTDINYRIFMAPSTTEIVKGTACSRQ